MDVYLVLELGEARAVSPCLADVQGESHEVRPTLEMGDGHRTVRRLGLSAVILFLSL